MGKGGEKIIKAKKTADIKSVGEDSVSSEHFKLANLSTPDLKKWAEQYGMPVVDDRVTLLATLNPFADGILDPYRPSNLPLAPPKFTLPQIRKAIPSHCFQRSLVTAFSHLFSDLAIIGVLYYISTFFSHPSIPSWALYIIWPVWWYAIGSVFTGVWVIAHECGHQAFSDYEWVNTVVGSICHSLLLVPYHSWRITHAKHHSNTGSVENDEVFAPNTRTAWGNEMLKETPIAQATGIFIMLTIGWMPGYLVFGATGPSKYKGKNVNHFSPTAAFFTASDYWLIVQSDICFFVALTFISYLVYTYGMTNMVFYYFIPYMITNYHLVLITFLQHTDVYMPHFRGKEWNWLRGALCTVDRSFGPLLDHTFHHIVDTHVCHHIFSSMPFYHAQEATEAIKSVIGPYYMKDETPIGHALWRAFSCCQLVEDEGGCVFYKNMK